MVWLGLIILVGFVLFLILDGQKNVTAKEKQYKYKTKALMTDNEFEFFNRLIKALPDYYVFPQVSMSAVLNADASNHKERMGSRGTFSQKTIDYVICDKKQNIVAIIELDDRTHDKIKDEKRDAMLSQVGYKIHRFESKQKPNIEEIKKLFS